MDIGSNARRWDSRSRGQTSAHSDLRGGSTPRGHFPDDDQGQTERRCRSHRSRTPEQRWAISDHRALYGSKDRNTRIVVAKTSWTRSIWPRGCALARQVAAFDYRDKYGPGREFHRRDLRAGSAIYDERQSRSSFLERLKRKTGTRSDAPGLCGRGWEAAPHPEARRGPAADTFRRQSQKLRIGQRAVGSILRRYRPGPQAVLIFGERTGRLLGFFDLRGEPFSHRGDAGHRG